MSTDVIEDFEEYMFGPPLNLLPLREEWERVIKRADPGREQEELEGFLVKAFVELRQRRALIAAWCDLREWLTERGGASIEDAQMHVRPWALDEVIEQFAECDFWFEDDVIFATDYSN